MGIKTKIEWCDSTWSPVTGCLHGCEYCYARRLANRFGGWNDSDGNMHHDEILKNESKVRELDKPLQVFREGQTIFSGKWQKAPYPYDFIPTLHRYRLDDYAGKKGRNIFVCSMADLFGKWIPDEWIEEVFKACDNAPQHNYIFLTKNPERYVELAEKGILRCSDNMWYGWSQTKEEEHKTLCFPCNPNTFISIEPILEPVKIRLEDWIIVGAETGRRKNKVVPERKWIEDIVRECREIEVPIFMKSSLAEIWGEPLIQEFPEGLKKER